MSASKAQPRRHVMHGTSAMAPPDPLPAGPHALKTQVRQYVMDNFLMGADQPELGDDDSFMDQHVIDSFGVVELVSFIEKTFHVKVEDAEMVPDNLDSVNGVVRYLQRKLERRT